jgi:magnesium transporter
MLASPSLKPMVPSASLLRFLRSQSDSLCYFTANHSSHSTFSSCPRDVPRRRNLRHHESGMRRASTSSWNYLVPVPCRAELEASLIPRFSLTLTKSSKGGVRLAASGLPKSPNWSSFSLLSSLQISRNSSTKSRPWLRRLLDLRRLKGNMKWDHVSPSAAAPPTTFVDDGSEGNLFNLGRALAAKTLNEPRLRCTEFDESGNVTLVNGEYRKSELIAKVGVPP